MKKTKREEAFMRNAVIYVRVGNVEMQIVISGKSYTDTIVKGSELLKKLSSRIDDFEILGIV